MKAIVDYENYRIELDKEARKAIRFCYGVNTDLRKSLWGLPLEPLKHWLEENRIRLFGQNMINLDTTSDGYAAMIDDVVRQLLN